MARALTLLLAGALAGCMDFVEPVLPDAPTRGSFELVLLQDEALTRVYGLLIAGLDEHGAPRVPVQPTLWLNDAAVEPEPFAEDSAQHNYETTLAGRAGTELLVRIPEVDDVDVPVLYAFAMRERVGPRDTTLAAGAPLVLRLTPPASEVEPPPDEHAWTLHAAGAESSFQATGRGAPPDTMLIPPELLPAEGSLRVVLTEHQYRSADDGADFHVRLRLARRFVWQVQILPPQ